MSVMESLCAYGDYRASKNREISKTNTFVIDAVEFLRRGCEMEWRRQ
jgi:hypothetical protein